MGSYPWIVRWAHQRETLADVGKGSRVERLLDSHHSISVIMSKLSDRDGTIGNLVSHAMLIGNTARPVSG